MQNSVENNPIAKALNQKILDETGDNIASGFSDAYADRYYDELRALPNPDNIGFVTSLASFIAAQSQQYARSKSSLTSTDNVLVDNAKTLSDSLNLVGEINRGSAWSKLKRAGELLGAASLGMKMLTDVPKAAQNWLTDKTIDKTSPEAQSFVKSLFVFSKMIASALRKDASYVGNLSMAGVKVPEVQTKLAEVIAVCQQTMLTSEEKDDELLESDDTTEETLSISSTHSLSPEPINATKIADSYFETELNRLYNRYLTTPLDGLTPKEMLDDICAVAIELEPDERERYQDPLFEADDSPQSLQTNMLALIQYQQKRVDSRKEACATIDKQIQSEIAAAAELLVKNQSRPKKQAKDLELIHQLAEKRVALHDFFAQNPLASQEKIEHFMRQMQLKIKIEHQQALKDTLSGMKADGSARTFDVKSPRF